ncbi:sulfotransferase domain-containing protein [Pyxidicoccus parkwayensis]|uniref:Sulfotransferase domain-containing protein n=1 Tax=Pyxidicoccus parkwayensis TaxID=2813578 RepID=A0ABX7NTQ3_9BACT|nr:sulfotransferase domain-containing protein [Pyxidicoccus parkwaysis]QSQ22259.1 sulfotransferase domain-containing protein [Pyxidicoccus parkwaysis]
MLLSVPVKMAGVVYNQGNRMREMLRFRLEFRPRPDDIYIATYPKSGTTWTQMLLVQLLSKGDAEFDHILQKSPYLEECIKNQRFAYLERLPSPRILKTHLPYGALRPAKDSRILFITRDAKDTFVSCYHHFELARRWRSPFDRFISEMVRGRGFFMSWYQYMREWMPHRSDSNVLWVRYEDMRKDLEGQARRIAAFLGIPVPEERMAAILEKCSFEYMRQHDHKFDFRTAIYEESPGTFIRQGGKGGPKQPLRAEDVAELEKNLAKLRGELHLKETEVY